MKDEHQLKINKKMDSLISALREKRSLRESERARLEEQRNLEYETRKLKLEEMQEDRKKCKETIVNNLNSITSHRHTISKVLHQSEQCVGLPISNKHHKQAVEIVTEAIKQISDQKYVNLLNNVDPEYLTNDIQCCTQAAMDKFKAMKSSAERIETLMQNINVISKQSNDTEADLETSIFDD